MQGPPDYAIRHIDAELDELAGAVAIAIDGPRGVGKTSTAARRANTLLRLDVAAVRRILEAGPEEIGKGTPPILVDEWQDYPAAWDLVRRAVDNGAPPGSFLLTGSAAPTVSPTHTGAGRIIRLRMRPMTLVERRFETPTVSMGAFLSGTSQDIGGSTAVTLANYADEIVASGFPAIRAQTSRIQRGLLDSYLTSVFDHEVGEGRDRARNPARMQAWASAYAAASSTSASYETIRDAASSGDGTIMARSTAQPYRETLERMWLLDPVPAWLPTRNAIARLTAGPKHQLADPALAARLLGIGVGALLDTSGAQRSGRDLPLLGRLFESLVTLCIRGYAQQHEARVGHLRTQSGRQEIDLIIERDDRRIVAVEVKLGQEVTDRDVRHLIWLRQEIGTDLLDSVVVTTGHRAYRRKDGIAVVPAAMLGP